MGVRAFSSHPFHPGAGAVRSELSASPGITREGELHLPVSCNISCRVVLRNKKSSCSSYCFPWLLKRIFSRVMAIQSGPEAPIHWYQGHLVNQRIRVFCFWGVCRIRAGLVSKIYLKSKVLSIFNSF